MGFMGDPVPVEPLPLVRGRDYIRTFVRQDLAGNQVPWGGDVFITLCNGKGVAPTVWHASVSGPNAVFKVESEECDKVLPRTDYQLVLLPAGEPAGGTPIRLGKVVVQGGCV